MTIGLGIGLGITIGGSGGGGVPPLAAALIARMTTASDTRKQQIINAFTTAADTPALLDFWHMLNSEDETQAALNWSQNLFNLTKVGTPAFTAGRGYQGNGTSQALATGYTPSTAAGKLTLNSASVGVMLLQSSALNAVELGNGADLLIGHTSLSEFKGFITSTTRVTGTTLSGIPLMGLVTLVRRVSGSVDYYIGRLKLGTYTNASSVLGATAIRYLAATSNLWSSVPVAGGFVGAALSDAQVAQLADAMHADMKATNAYLYPAQILAFGNSRTFGTGSADPTTQSYPYQLQALYDGLSAGYNVTKQGFPGQTTPTLDGYLDTNISVRAAAGFPAKKRVMVFWEAVNDLTTGGATPTQAVDHIQSAITKARTHGYDKILVCNEIASANTVSTQGPFNVELSARWSSFADGMIDLASAPELSDYNNTTYFNADQLHLVQAGYAVVAAKVKTAVDAILATF